MTQKKKPTTSPNRDRVVYEVRTGNTPRQVEATSTAELKKALAPLLNLDPYSVQAAAHLAHVERATVQGNGWSVKRLGVLSFVPDGAAPTTAQRRLAAQSTDAPNADTEAQVESQSTPDSAPTQQLQEAQWTLSP